MTSYQTATARVIKLTSPRISSVAIICGSSLFLGDGILRRLAFIDLVQNCGGIPVVTIAMSMIRREAGEDKQTARKSETAITREHWRCAVSAPLMAGPGRLAPLSSGDAGHSIAHLLGFSAAIALLRFAAGACSRWRRGCRLLSNWHQRYYPNHGVVVNGARHRIYCHRNKSIFPACSTKLPPVDIVWRPKGRLVTSL